MNLPALESLCGEQLNNLSSEHILTKVKDSPHRNEFLQYVDRSVDAFLSILDAQPEPNRLRERKASEFLKPEQFFSTLTEFEWAGILRDAFGIPEMEPLYPNQGPDFKVESGGNPIFIEIYSVNASEAEQNSEKVRDALENGLKGLPGGLIITGKFKRGIDPETAFHSGKKLLNCIIDANKQNVSLPWTLWIEEGRYLEARIAKQFDFFNPPEPLSDFLEEFQVHQAASSSPVVLVVKERGNKEILILMDEEGFTGYSQRVRSRASEKISQLPKNEASVMVVDTSSQSLLGPETVFMSAYGDLSVDLQRHNKLGIIGSSQRHLRNGLFANSTRLSAAVYQKRSIWPDAKMRLFRYVFPSNNPEAVLHLGVPILEKFGVVKDQTTELSDLSQTSHCAL